MNKTLLSSTFSSLFLASSLVSFSAIVGCSSDDPATPPPAACSGAACNSAGSAGASAAGAGGASAGTAGNSAGSAGVAGEGGDAGSSGSAGDGGSAGAGGESGAAGAAGNAGNAGNAGASGTAGSAGSAGSGGAGNAGTAGSPECTVSSDCLGSLDPECVQTSCNLGVCERELAPNTTVLADLSIGDCHVSMCDGNGHKISIVSAADPPVQIASDCQLKSCGPNGDVLTTIDDTDVEDDGDACTLDICNGDLPSHPFASPGTACGTQGVCTGTGICGICIPDAQQCHAGTPQNCSAAGTWVDAPERCSNLGCASDTSECNTAVQVTAGDTFSCALISDGSVRCWGANTRGQLGANFGSPQSSTPLIVALPVGSIATSIAGGQNHACALLSSGEVYCWGDNMFGQLGAGQPANFIANAPVFVASGITSLQAGWNDTCVWNPGLGTVCWGNNSGRQLTVAANAFYSSAVTPDYLNPIAPGKFSIGPVSGCRVDTSSATSPALLCWGNNVDGQIKSSPLSGFITTPFSKTNVPQPRDVSVGSGEACAVTTTGSVYCWGYKVISFNGSSTKVGVDPTLVIGLSNAAAIQVGTRNHCALNNSGELYCWGANTAGQLGITKTDGTINPAVSAPTLVPNATHVTAFALGSATHSCFVDSGKVYCMGANASGELGHSGDASPTPVEVVW